ncbi:hypothetical protein PVM10_04285 [Klebsiella variicola]|uniref:DUF6945 domain-containing protein n=1 Tax=Klebsiella variicola TaxID=244366 RepID=UPI00237A00DD|nr:hypothetical protein [Klebsiella variicola]MDD9254482.1 hypothetical protein [Klebsiella variicola]
MRAKKTKVPQATAKRTPPPDEPYTNIEMRLVCASKIKIVNGEHAGTVINWDSDMLRLYLYMFNQVKGFESRHGEFYQSQDRIKLSVGLGKTKLNESLDALKMLGLIRKTGIKTVKGAPRGLIKYTAVRLMEVIGNLEIIFAEDDGEPVWDHERASGNAAKKSEEKQENGNGHEEAETPQAEQAAATATSSTDAPTGESADQSRDLASEPAASTVGQRDSVESDNDGSSDDRAAGNHAVSQRAQEYKDDAVFPSEKREPEETTGRVIAPLDDLRYWSCVGDDGRDDYGVMWGESGAGLDNLIGEHLKIREAEAEKNFLNRRG